MRRLAGLVVLLGVVFGGVLLEGAQPPLAEPWDYADAMKAVAARGTGRAGVVLHVGDSITHANPYGQWARYGRGQSAEDKDALGWMHRGADDASDGWWLCRFDHPGGGRSYTATGGVTAEGMLAGGHNGLPSLADMLDRYRPQAVVYMLGTNDASASRPVAAFEADMVTAVDAMLDRGVVCILSTIPPHPRKQKLAAEYNEALRKIARDRRLPLIDYEKEILQRRPHDWNGTLMNPNDPHPSAGSGQVDSASLPTDENLRTSGYLLRGWLSVKKLVEVKRRVFDEIPARPGPPEPVAPLEVPPAAKTTPAAPPAQPPADAPQAAPAPNPPPRVPTAPASSPTAPNEPSGQRVRLPITRDTWFSEVGQERDCNLGGADRLKLKSIQEMSVVDFDPAPLRGRVIRSAVLCVRDRQEVLRRVTVGTFGAEWVEGTSTSYAPQQGSSSFNARRHPDVPWAQPASDLTAVVLGQGGTLWRMVDATPPDANGWQRIPVDPLVVAARVAGTSHGLFLFDDTGSEWSREGEKYTFRHMPNRFVCSREAGPDSAPYLDVWLGEPDNEPPPAPAGFVVDLDGCPAGEAEVSWITPVDEGPAGTVGFLVDADGTPLPRYLIPPAGRPSGRVTMRLRDLAVCQPGASVRLAVRAVDATGNVSPPGEHTVRLSDAKPRWLDTPRPKPFAPSGPLPRLGETRVAVIDALDKVQPLTGRMIPEQPAEYLQANHLWDAGKRRIRLAAAGNEFVAFQVLLDGPTTNVEPSLTFTGAGRGIHVAFAWYRPVETDAGPLPDPLVPLDAPDDATNAPRRSLYVELYVPHEAAPGDCEGKLTLRAGEATLELDVLLTVWRFVLPDRLSFLPEMNCYGLPANERDYYRLAHRHRTVLNRVPYSHAGRVADGCAPAWDGENLDWTAWDRRYGPLLDGSATADLPRRGVPIECFYLPLHENWPCPMEGHYRDSYWADVAFSPDYRPTFVEVARRMTEHFKSRGWNDTLFQFYLNNKSHYKRDGWSRASSPWVLDEPMDFQDFWALRFFGEAFHEGVRRALGGSAGPRMLFRCDISRPQWQRDALDHVLDYNVVGGGPFRRYHRAVADRQRAFGQIVLDYGTTNAVDQSNMQPVGWCLDSWSLGSRGVLPWQTIGNAQSWTKGDALALFYPGEPIGQAEPVPSIRLKAYCRGQQDVEYMTLLADVLRAPAWQVGQGLRGALRLAGERCGTGFTAGEDAGAMHYAALRPRDVWAVRTQAAQAIDAAAPKPRDRLVSWDTPPRDPAAGAPAYVAGRMPSAGEALTPSDPQAPHETDASPPRAAAARVIQGRDVVVDTIIDPTEPDRNFGREARDNRLKRTHACNAMLLRFDLEGAGIPAGARVQWAEVVVYVWDPSSQGQTKLCAFEMKTPWRAAEATWNRPAQGQTWRGGEAFAFGEDTGESLAHVVVAPDAGGDVADPPIEYRLDVTELVRAWLDRKTPNNGVAIAPAIDRAVDDGHQTRMQVLASEAQPERFTPKLEIGL
ncbi:MAG: DNRLRE domain-containing protein [Pirellulales bacterium]|nr:DNRLRE domain-containing protein [Pirellulales bacterium]